jgi:hypothetical protein
MSEPVAVEVLEDDSSNELAPYEPPSTPITLFGTNDPLVALERMAAIATPLSELVHERKLFVRIRGNEYLYCSAWKTLGGMVGIAPYTVWTKPNETGDGYVARVEVRTFDERTIGAAEAECSRAESRWAKAEPHALRSMAETRATSRALRGPLEQIVVLAGYSGTAVEEMSFDEPEQEPAKPPTAPVQPTPEQTAELKTLLRSLDHADAAIDWPARAREIAKVPWEVMTRSQAAHLIEELQGELAALMPDDETSAV